MLASMPQSLPSACSQAAVVDQQLGLAAPHRDVGDVVLEDLELADLLAEGLAFLHVLECVLEHAVEDAACTARRA